MGCAKGLCGKNFRFSDNGNGVALIVKRLHAVDINAEALLTEKFRKFRVAPAVFVTRDIKRNDTHFAEFLERLVNRRSGLVG